MTNPYKHLEDMHEQYNKGLLDGVYLERLRIHQGVKDMEDKSHRTRTPIYQDTFFKKIKELLHGTSN